MDSVTRQVEVGQHRIEATVAGSGTPAVVIEPGFGSTAASWRAVADAVAADTTVVTYDRAPYAAEQLLMPELAWHIRALDRLTLPVMLMMPRQVRSGADRRSLIREMRALTRLTARDKPLAAGGLGDRPLIVITAGQGKLMNGRPWQVWHGLQAELAALSANQRHIVADRPGHYVHKSDPDLVITAIREVVHSARTRTPLLLER